MDYLNFLPSREGVGGVLEYIHLDNKDNLLSELI